MPDGVIIKALSGYYYVVPDDHKDSESVECRARGLFKKQGLTPKVGDRVIYEPTEVGKGWIIELLPRDNELIRPPIANVNQALLVFSLREPDFNPGLLDKFLVHIEHAGIPSILVFTKTDLFDQHASDSDKEEMLRFEQLYRKIGYPVHRVSTVSREGVDLLLDSLQGQTSVIAGQSGVGKTSILNALHPGLDLETASISNKLGRGRHTTRHVEFIRLPQKAFIADTPGFSQLDFREIEAEDLSSCFKEFVPLAQDCKFRGCLHVHEPGCQILEAKENGEVAESRYQHYLQFLQEIQERKRRY